MKSLKGDTAVPSQGATTEKPPTVNLAIAQYVAELKATINKYRSSIFQLLQSCPASTPLPDLTTRYDELQQLSFPIILGLAILITHLWGNAISSEDIDGFTQQAEANALVLPCPASSPPF